MVRGTRLSVEFLLGLFAAGWSEEQVLNNYPNLRPAPRGFPCRLEFPARRRAPLERISPAALTRRSSDAPLGGRVVLTFDRNYGRLHFGETGKPVPPGIVYFRFDPSPPEEPVELLLGMLE